MSIRTKSALLAGAAIAQLAAASPALAQASASPFTSATRYDAQGRIAGTIAPDPDANDPLHHSATRNSYDAAGRLTKIEKGELAAWQAETVAPASWAGFTVLQVIDTQYDPNGNKVKESLSGVASDASGPPTLQSVTEYNYDENGRLKCKAVRMNPDLWATPLTNTCVPGTPHATYGADRISRNDYDEAGQLVQNWEGVGTSDLAAEATRAYWPNGTLKWLIDAKGSRSEMRYDEFDRLQCWVLPSPIGPSGYNPSTQATALATAGSVNGDCASTGDFEYYGYDANGNRTSLRNRAGETLGYTFDALDRMSYKDRPGSEPDVSYTYDLRGLQLSATFPATGEAVTQEYDGFGRVSSSTTIMGGISKSFAYQYGADGNRIGITHPDGAAFAFDYDGLGRMMAIRHGGATLIGIAYDPFRRRRLLTRGDGSAADYRYDGASRLTRLNDDLMGSANDQTVTLAYNPASQIVSRHSTNDVYRFTSYVNGTNVATPDGLNRLTGLDGATPTYDARGNMTSDGTKAYTYSSENLLTSAVGSTALGYDPLMRFHDYVEGGAGRRNFYDGQQLLVEAATAGPITGRHVFGPGADEALITYSNATTAASSTFYLHTDERGSIAAATRATDGSVLAFNRYDEYGVPGPLPRAFRFRFTGQAFWGHIGLYNFKARWYHPGLGRFMQTDPVGYDDQINLYAYVRNDPINHHDSSGKRIALTMHQVVRGRDEYHAKIVIVPDDQRAFRNDSRFLTSPGGKVFVTIGGGPDSWRSVFGSLVGDLNRPTDVDKVLTGESLTIAEIRPGAGDTENDLIRRLLGVAESYGDDLEYCLFPSKDGDDYNSSSFAYGVLEAVGGKPPLPQGYDLPGASKPVPQNEFCKPRKEGCEF